MWRTRTRQSPTFLPSERRKEEQATPRSRRAAAELSGAQRGEPPSLAVLQPVHTEKVCFADTDMLLNFMACF